MPEAGFAISDNNLPDFCYTPVKMTRLLSSSALIAAVLALGWACTSSKPATDSKIYNMGDRVQVGPLHYTALETEWLPQIGEGTDAKIPRHQFLAIRLRVFNSGSTTSGIPAIQLLDAKGESFNEAEGTGLANWFGAIRIVKPVQTEDGRVVFDVPAGSYRLRVGEDADADEQKTALIEIPYQIAPSAPEPVTAK